MEKPAEAARETRELAGSCVGCPIDGLRGFGHWGRPLPKLSMAIRL